MECNCHKAEFAYRVVENGSKCGVKCAVEMQAGERPCVSRTAKDHFGRQSRPFFAVFHPICSLF